jgi:NAD(P)-dependent dehydrogenase (short-subunit alcohol dehydrogenase family)
MDKENKRVVLVTGASSGIGLACATHLAGRGYRVYGTSRRAGTGRAGTVAMLVADVSDDHSVERAVAAVLEREGRLDIVVNNAGMGIAGRRKHLNRGSKEATRGKSLRRFPGLPRRAATY